MSHAGLRLAWIRRPAATPIDIDGDLGVVSIGCPVGGVLPQASRRFSPDRGGPKRQFGGTVWRDHEPDLRASGDLFFTWQYDIRWAAQRLRDQRVFVPNAGAPQGFWQLAS